MSAKHTESLLLLPMYHKDPFDHMILAQAKNENMTIITGDSIFKKYLPDTIVIWPPKKKFFAISLFAICESCNSATVIFANFAEKISA